MKVSARYAIWLLPLLLTSCAHKQQKAAQPLAPPIDAASKAPPPDVEHEPLTVTIPSQPLETEPIKPLARKHKPAVKRADSPAKATDTPETKPAEQAANETPGVSAIGQLSSGDSSDLRQQTAAEIAGIERGLREIDRGLSDREQKIAVHIKEYLKQAKAALASGDADGAHTLAAKAKVLLGELSR